MSNNQFLTSNVEQFRAFARPYGLEPPEQLEPGRFYRFSGAGKKSTNQSAWCILFPDRLGGCFGDFSSDLFESWQVKRSKPLTVAEREAFQKQLNEVKEKYRLEVEEKQIKAQQEAVEIWQSSTPAENNHPYLLKKGVKSHGLRVYRGDKSIGGMTCDGALLVPLRQDKMLKSLQFISRTGEKRFLSGGKKTGCYFSIGKTDHHKPCCIAEGYATAASIFEATGYPVAVAFDAGNLEAVAMTLHQRFPNNQLIVCADDDYASEANLGLTKAKSAALAIDAQLSVPDFGESRPDGATDFNDLHNLKGLEAVRECVAAAVNNEPIKSAIDPNINSNAAKVCNYASRYHGAVGLAWLRAIVSNQSQLADFITDGIQQFVDEFTAKGMSGQVLRVARRFALVAVAGELATHYGLTGWSSGEAINAARKCFVVWLESFGSMGNREDRAILSQVRAFFEAHGASRFDDIKFPNNERIRHRAGFYRTGINNDREYMVLTEVFKQEICQGFDSKVVIRLLLNEGWLEPGNDGKTTQKPRIPGVGTPRCYVFTGRIWESE